MTNLLQETLNQLESNDRCSEDVIWVGSSDGKFSITWAEFAKIADVDYNAGYGSQLIASDLVVVGDDFWLDRDEYDGSECWTFNSLPVPAKKPKTFTTVNNGGTWATVEEMQKAGGKYGDS